jgi:hypothetical protein
LVGSCNEVDLGQAVEPQEHRRKYHDVSR